MKITGIKMALGLTKEVAGFVLSAKSSKRKERTENIKELVAVTKQAGKTRSTVSWIFTGVMGAVVVYDMVANDGVNFENLMTLLITVAGG